MDLEEIRRRCLEMAGEPAFGTPAEIADRLREKLVAKYGTDNVSVDVDGERVTVTVRDPSPKVFIHVRAVPITAQ